MAQIEPAPPGGASASETPYDFMVGNAPLREGELLAAFDGATHDGVYRFEREEVGLLGFRETTFKDRRVRHKQGAEIITGTWTIKQDRMCYLYDEAWTRELCFDMYRVGNCYFHVLRSEGGRKMNLWTARSSLTGETPNCEPSIS